MGMRQASSGEVSSCLKAGGKGRGRGVFLSSDSGDEDLFLGFSSFLLVPSEVFESWLAGCETDEEEAVCVFSGLGFQLVIEARSARVIVLMGLDCVRASCLAGTDEDGSEEAGLGSPCQVQS